MEGNSFSTSTAAASRAANAEGWETLPNSLDGMHWWSNRGLRKLNFFVSPQLPHRPSLFVTTAVLCDYRPC